MNDLLKTVLSMSLSGSITIVILLFLLSLCGKKLSRQWQYYIWLIAVLRLLIPIAPRQNLMNTLFSKAEVAESGQLQETGSQPDSLQLQWADYGGMDKITAKPSSQKPKGAGRMQTSLSIIKQYLWIFWIILAFIFLIRKITIYQRFTRYIRAGSKEVQDITLLEHLSRLAEKSHIKTAITLEQNSLISSPILIGFFHPCVILPSGDLSDSDFAYTILHELVHYKRKDMVYKWLVQLTVCAHWFNPFTYVLLWNTNRLCELSCDEAVIWGLDKQERYAYGDTLLRAAGRNIKYKSPVPPISFSNNAKNLKERLGAIMNFKKISKATYITMFSLTVLLFVCSSYVGVYAATKRNAAATDTFKTKKSVSHSAQAPHSVLYKNGEYFILFDNADENDIPGSTGPDYGVTFGAVWPDAYVSFNSYYINKNLSSKMKKECKHMQNKGWLTKKEANAIIDVALKVQQGDTDGFKTDKQEKEYSKWHITIKNGVYYYKSKRIRILMDTRKDRSFKNFSYDKKGKVDIKVIRNSKNKITKVKYLPKKNAQKILDDLRS